MITSVRGDIYTRRSSAQFYAAIGNGSGLLFTASNAPDFQVFNLSTLSYIASGLTNYSFPSGMGLLGASSVVISYGTNSAFDFINPYSLGTATAVTTNANNTYAQYGNQLACNINTGYGMATRSSTGGVTLINGTTLSVLAPSALAGFNSTAVCAKLDNGNFFVGASNGQLLELSTAGTVINSITLPTTPNIGTTPADNVICGISYNAPNVAFTTKKGNLYVYNWTTFAQVYKTLVGYAGSQNTSLSIASSGECWINKAGQPTGTYGSPFQSLYFETPNPAIQSTYYTAEHSSNITSSGFDPSLNVIYMVCDNSSSSNYPLIRVFNSLPTIKTTVNTRAQYPLGTDIAARIIRLRDEGIGSAAVEIDTTIAAGSQPVQCTNGRNYIEIALNGTSTFDIREFQA